MHGAMPYIMAIAMIYASPIVIVALKDGKKRKNGRVVIERGVLSRSQPLSKDE